MALRWNVGFILLIFLLKVTAGEDIPGSAFTHNTTALIRSLLRYYHKDVPPVEVNGKPIILGVSFELISFHFLNEATGLLSTNAWFTETWTDLRLQWDSELYNGSIDTMIRVDPSDLWQPDIEVLNGLKVDKVRDHRVILHPNGFIFSTTPYIVESKCDMNLRYFPYDEQKCILKFGSWTYHGSVISLKIPGTRGHQGKVHTKRMHPSEDFVLLNTSSLELVNNTSECCPEYYPECIVTLRLKRSSGAYSAKLILPSVLSGLMVLATFLLPPASHEKITLCGITFLALLLLLVYLQSIVPASGDTITGEYLAFALCIDFFATILAVASYVMHGRGSKPMNSGDEGDHHELKIQSRPTSNTAWFRYLDLASFVIFSVVFVIDAAIMLGRRE